LRNSEKTRAPIFPTRRPLFYYITDRKHLSGESLLTSIQRAADWGVDFVQIREKDLSDNDLFDLTAKAVALVRGSGCRILVNSRADIALAAGAHGVHLPSAGLRRADLVSWLPSRFLVGVSVHSGAEAARAALDGAHYLLMGPVFTTLSKVAYGPPLGLKTLCSACQDISVPILALGGIGPQQIKLVMEVGAAGVAGISLFQNRLHELLGKAVELKHHITHCRLPGTD
jgi:thiamine-phosphate pyrophosphorylase